MSLRNPKNCEAHGHAAPGSLHRARPYDRAIAGRCLFEASGDLPLTPGPEGFAQLGIQHLACARHRQCRHEVHAARTLLSMVLSTTTAARAAGQPFGAAMRPRPVRVGIRPPGRRPHRRGAGCLAEGLRVHVGSGRDSGLACAHPVMGLHAPTPSLRRWPRAPRPLAPAGLIQRRSRRSPLRRPRRGPRTGSRPVPVRRPARRSLRRPARSR